MHKLSFRTVGELEAAVGGPPAQSGWHTVTQPMIDVFADVTRDRQWIHLERERASRESPFGTTIAHGLLVLSLLPALIHECVELPPVRLGINYGFDRVRFVSPVPAGAEIMGRFTLAEIKPAADMVSLSWQVELALRDAAKPALAATWLVRLVTGDGTP